MQQDDFKSINSNQDIWIKNYETLKESIKLQNDIIKIQKENEIRLKQELEQSRKPVFFFNIN